MSGVLDNARKAAWLEIADKLGGDPKDTKLLSRVEAACYNWAEYLERPGDLAPSIKMKNDLQEVGNLAFELAEKLAVVRNYAAIEFLIFKNGFTDLGDGTVSPFSDNHLDLIRKAGALASHASDELHISRGQKGDVARRFGFIAAASIYEDYTGRKIAYSYDAEQKVSGPFVDYMMAFCRFCFPSNRHETGSVAAFCDWMRETKSAARDPLLRLLGLEVARG